MIVVVMRIDEIRRLVTHAVGGGNLIHGTLDVVPDACRRVEQDDPVACRHERTLVSPVRDSVDVPLDPPDVVASSAERRSERRIADRRANSEPVAGRPPLIAQASCQLGSPRTCPVITLHCRDRNACPRRSNP